MTINSSSQDISLGTLEPSFPLFAQHFKLKPQDQAYHATVWGRAGSGKSRLLQSIFIQHLNKYHGVGIIEPHHDLSIDSLTYLIGHGFFENDAAFDRLVYIDWGNGHYVPFNILADDGRTDDYTRALNALEGMLRVWPELQDAPMFQTLFLSCMLALIANNLPITFIHQLLTDTEFRATCLANVGDPLVHQSFEHFDKLGRDQASLAGSTLRRAFLLTFNPISRLTLGQPDNWLPFRKWMDEGKSFIINLGNINDSETKKLIGAMVMVQIEQAALSRTDIAQCDRKPLVLLVDEWSSFAAQDRTIGTILSQTRKFGLTLYLAAQSLSQVSSERLAGALENCRLSINFGLGRDSAEIQAKQIGQADPFAIKEEALTLTQHAQYLSVVEQFESWTQELQNLSTRMAYVKLHDKPPVKIKTLSVPNVEIDSDKVEKVLEEYKSRYQRTKEESEQAIAKVSVPTANNVQPSRTDSGEHSSNPAYTNLFQRRNGQNDKLPN